MGRGGETPFPLVERQKTEIVLVHADDWAGVYLDGELHSEGPEGKISVASVIKEVGMQRSEIDEREVYVDETWWEEEAGGNLPEEIDALVLDDES